MSGITVGGRPLSDLSDDGLTEWFNRTKTSPNRLQADTAAIWGGIFRILDRVFEEVSSVTIRQVFYQAEVAGMVPKTENGYDTVQRQLMRMRNEGVMPYDWIADYSRWIRKPDTHESLADFLADSQKSYRRALWHQQSTYVEIWCEKDALAGLMYEVTDPWDVPLCVVRGYSSDTFPYTTMKARQGCGKPVYVYYFGDHDPSGRDISRDLEKKLGNFAERFKVDLHFNRVAVTLDQIERWDLPTRPTKKTDSRAKNWKGESAELDAIPPGQLKKLVEGVIERHIDPRLLKQTRAIEEAERGTLEAVAKNLGLAASSDTGASA